VAETPATVFVALADATLEEVQRSKLVGVRPAPEGPRSSAWALVSASQRLATTKRSQLDELITSFVIRLIDRSIDHARAFALDALDADCPGWLNMLKLTTSEREFLYASYQAERGNSAAAVERLLTLPEDRYPTKDFVFMRCLGVLQADETMRESARSQLEPFAERPIGQAILSILYGSDLPENTWRDAALAVLASSDAMEGNFPRQLASSFFEALDGDSALPPEVNDLAPAVRRLSLARAVRGGTHVPAVTLADLEGGPDALLDDALEHGAVTPTDVDRNHPAAGYVFARVDPDVLTHDELVAVGHDSELARRAFLRGDREGLLALASPSTAERLMSLLELKDGGHERALDRLDIFDEPTRAKVASLGRALADRSISGASDEVLTDGTTWPVLAPLLPDDVTALNDLGASRPALRGVAAWRVLSGATSCLWDWDWEGAITDAKRCLMVARDEQTRDEALNIIAGAHWQLGDDQDAVAALSHALDGQYTEALQVNMGVVAAALEPQLAGQHLGKLALQAPTLALRVSAANRALEVWFADPDPWDDQADEHALPTQLRDAMRALVTSGIDEASFVRFARTMSRWDDEWFADPDNLAGSIHYGSAAATVYQAKARDFEEFVEELASVVAHDDPPEWATTERDNLAGAAIASLDPKDANPNAAAFGLVLIDHKLPMDAEMQIDLVGFTVLAICAGIDPAEGEPKERFLDMVEEARQRVGEVKADEQERSGKLLDFTTMRVAGAIAAARANQYDQVVDMYNRILFQVRGTPSYRINRSALRDATAPAVDFLRDTLRILDRLIELVTEPEFKQNLTGFRDQVRELSTAFVRLGG
jgi:hypothetical protein